VGGYGHRTERGETVQRVGSAIVVISWVAWAIIDIVAVIRVFADYGLIWAVVSVFAPPAWFIIPFLTGLGALFVGTLTTFGIGLWLSELRHR